MNHSFFMHRSEEKMRNFIRNDIAASPLRFSSPLASANQSQKQSQGGKSHSSRCACRLGADGGLPLVRHFTRFAHGIHGALRAWASPLGGFAGDAACPARSAGLALDVPPQPYSNRFAIRVRLPAPIGAAAKRMPKRLRSGMRGFAPHSKTGCWGILSALGREFFGGSPRS